MAERLPARLDRAAFERVLQRAAELQAGSREIGESLSEDEILALGTEVGLSTQYLKQALIEEQLHPVGVTPSTLDRWIGAGEVAAERVVQGTDEAIAAAITRWLDHHERFVVQRAAPGRLTFERMDALAGTMRRVGAMFDPARARPYLAKAELITAVITPLEAGFCHVMLGASLRKSRAGYAAGGVTVGAAGVIAGGVIAVAGASLLIAVVPVAVMVGIGAVAARSFHRIAARARVGLERALDELERRPAIAAESSPPRPAPLGQVVRDIAQEVKRAFER